MKGDVQHSGVLVEGLLGAVAMVNVLWREMGSELGRSEREMGLGQAGKVSRSVTIVKVGSLDLG